MRPAALFLYCFLSAIFAASGTYGQLGCTDLQATNYDPSAVINDGSCVYAATTLSTTQLNFLQTPILDENSGLFFKNNQLWSHVDDTYNELYEIDTISGYVTRTVALSAAYNYDWEEAQVDSQYVYVGDIGNNYGNRTDLKFFRYPLSVLDTPSSGALPDTIFFSYSDQTDFTSAFRTTRFDAEAFIVVNDTIQLFSKDWKFKQARRYTIPAIPGVHIAQLQDSISAAGLITGASISSNGVVVLVGYDNAIPPPCFLWALYDYSGSSLYSGNKRKFSIGSAITVGQTEGICFRSGEYGYISNERFQQSIFNVAPQLRSFDLSPFLIQNSTSINVPLKHSFFVYPIPALDVITIDGVSDGSVQYRLYDLGGRQLLKGVADAIPFSIRRDGIAGGIYLLEVSRDDESPLQLRIVLN